MKHFIGASSRKSFSSHPSILYQQFVSREMPTSETEIVHRGSTCSCRLCGVVYLEKTMIGLSFVLLVWLGYYAMDHHPPLPQLTIVE